jgi:hypothetical protein
MMAALVDFGGQRRFLRLERVEGSETGEFMDDERLGSAELTRAGIGGGGILKISEGGGNPVTGADERLEEGWGTTSTCSSSRGDSAGETFTMWGGSGLLRAG